VKESMGNLLKEKVKHHLLNPAYRGKINEENNENFDTINNQWNKV